MSFFSRIKEFFHRKQKPVVLGLSLGSGGAKGMAHLGALKAFEEEGLEFSVVSGASIGAIVGALYAYGYSSSDMMGIVEGLNRREFSKNLRPFADLGFAEEFLSRYLDCDLSDLRKPFAAWVTGGTTNTGAAVKSGPAARVLTASAAIPPFFRGVELDGKKYYDGAFTNAVPAEVCREMGAELVIGIDLAAHMQSEEEKGRLSRLLGSAVNAIMPVKYTEDCRSRGYAAVDLMLRPDLKNFAATDVSPAAMDAMFEAGYLEAKAQMETIGHLIGEARRRVSKRHQTGRDQKG